jgi:hypothetical protein
MNEDKDSLLSDAYERLGTALAPPPDVAARVEREVGARRRRRLTAWAGAAALVVAGTAGTVAVLGSGDGSGGDTVAADPGDADKPPVVDHGTFVLTRADGSTHEFTQLTVSCDTGPTGDKVAPGHIMLYSPYDATEDGKGIKAPFVYFDADVTAVNDKSFTLPGEADGLTEAAFVLFAADPGADGAGDAVSPNRANEVSSAESGAAGTVRVAHAACGANPELELEVDTTLGSEVQQGTAKLVGSYR